jgi:hypothetical protein
MPPPSVIMVWFGYMLFVFLGRVFSFQLGGIPPETREGKKIAVMEIVTYKNVIHL